MSRTVLRMFSLAACAFVVALLSQSQAQSKAPACPDGKVRVLNKCFDPCPEGSAHDSHGKCSLCAD
ncbi:MAG TPA: hypothetical protein PKD61_11110, partial [Polyangiaceae bacterium]|nr:hypothetical protein [Polyangiaceae bacterium]